MSRSQLWLTASITEQFSSAILLSSLLPAGTAWRAAEVIHRTAVTLQVEREQKSFPVNSNWIRERTAGNVGAALCSSLATKLQAALDTESIESLSSEGKQLNLVVRTTEGCKANLSKIQSPWGRPLCAVCLQQLPWLKYVGYEDTCSVTKWRAFHL